MCLVFFDFLDISFVPFNLHMAETKFHKLHVTEQMCLVWRTFLQLFLTYLLFHSTFIRWKPLFHNLTEQMRLAWRMILWLFLMYLLFQSTFVWCKFKNPEWQKHHTPIGDHEHNSACGPSFQTFTTSWSLVVQVTSFHIFNSDQFCHPAGWTPKKTSHTACRIKGLIMNRGREHKADLRHFTLVAAAAVCTRLDKQCCSENKELLLDNY